MARIDKATIDRVLDVTKIEDVVSDFVSLKKRGSSYLGLCPFHNERTPSFSVSPSRGIFKCFSCGKAGNAVSFLMDLEGMSYVEAIKWLGHKYNIEVAERELTSAEKEAEATRESMFAVNEYALKHFENTLHNTPDGREIGLAYFRERGISDKMIEKFHLGYALERPSDDLFTKAVAAGFPEKYLVDTGLAIKTDTGRIYDRFKGRVIYPVHSLSGRVVAFGGRTLRKEKTVAKYVNSPESVIYSKKNEIYGMYQARQSIARKKYCIIVEGYMDVISMHQAGVENTVSSSGTSLTEEQVRIIKRFTNDVILIYDCDAAGIKASLRGINLLIAAGISLKLVLLPEGEDPDSYAQGHSSSEVEQYIEEHKTDFIGFIVEVKLREAGNDPRKRSEAINEILQTIAQIPDVVEQSLYLDECSRKVGIEVEVLSRQLKLFVAKRAEENYKRRQVDEARASIDSIVADAPPSEAGAVQADAAKDRVDVAAVTTDHAVYRAEEELIRYVLRYGLMYMCDVYPDAEATEPVAMTVLDYIECELRHDNVEISHPVFRQIWDMAIGCRDRLWADEKQKQEEILLRRRSERLAEGQEQIRAAGGDTASILELEKALTERVDKEFNASVDKFAAGFVNKMILRSDDRRITDLVARLTAEPVVLSRMYPKVDVREDVCAKLPIAVCTLKSTLLKQELKQITKELEQPHTPEELNVMMTRYMDLKRLSMEFDKFNGEIVITPGLGGPSFR